MNFKKLPYHLLLLLLTLGASLILGLLSFGGFFALWPSIPFAAMAFGLSVAYEGEIYFQNIKGALNKLFNPHYLKNKLSDGFLNTYFPHHLAKSQWPRFFIDYERALIELHAYEHPALSNVKRPKKEIILKKIRLMERNFATQLNAPSHDPLDNLTKDTRDLRLYLAKYPIKNSLGKITHESLPEKYKTLLRARQFSFRSAQVFSGLAALFMSFGTTYLLMEAFTIIPFLAAIPFAFFPPLILPMAIISGIAYGLLTYNTITNMIAHDTIRTRFKILRDDFKKNGLTLSNGLMTLATVTLSGLALALTLCTAGTWWTIVKETRPLFSWMLKIPAFIMGICTPLITGIAALAFNLENSNESLNMLESTVKNNRKTLRSEWAAFRKKLSDVRQRENTTQLLNPFRLLLACTITPLRYFFFAGHLGSIALTANRVPGFSKMISSFFNVLTELFEDLHYFVKTTEVHQHDLPSLLNERLGEEAGHSHNAMDLPTRILLLIATPLYALSNLWNYAFSQWNPPERRLTLKQAFQKPMIMMAPSFSLTPPTTPLIKTITPTVIPTGIQIDSQLTSPQKPAHASTSIDVVKPPSTLQLTHPDALVPAAPDSTPMITHNMHEEMLNCPYCPPPTIVLLRPESDTAPGKTPTAESSHPVGTRPARSKRTFFKLPPMDFCSPCPTPASASDLPNGSVPTP
jgi:hypothetical protein